MPTITSSDPTRPQPQIPIDLLAPSTPSNTLKRKNFESIDENTLQPEDAESPMKVSKGPGRPKKPADPDKAAKAGVLSSETLMYHLRIGIGEGKIRAKTSEG